MTSMRRSVLWYGRAVASSVILVLCGMIVVLWMRSYFFEDRVTGLLHGVGIRVYSSRGRIVVSKNTEPDVADKYSWQLHLGRDYWLSLDDVRLRVKSPIALFQPASYASATAPHWFFVVPMVLLALVLKTRPRWSVSLAELMIMMTVTAIGMAAVMWLARFKT
jgi:hypothetical protein